MHGNDTCGITTRKTETTPKRGHGNQEDARPGEAMRGDAAGVEHWENLGAADSVRQPLGNPPGKNIKKNTQQKTEEHWQNISKCVSVHSGYNHSPRVLKELPRMALLQGDAQTLPELNN